ncbi:hypothetical protein EXM22_08120 [Oceanispirochaeta crateris]|uniref:Uncharacterized protein n=1 Tax=Oceanispirochaeta crateris TaxID=2518645 RepID=A0A5C1QLU8_9SPIO|nr:hypothetical protein [Oceanispirochaeta crateris]QEN07950.1 hypothetical protein EXM22_08120 [Oceanispirochaeta crateris]
MVNQFKMNNKRDIRASGIGFLLILFAFLILPVGTVPVYAQPVWSGNASVDASEFVNFMEDFPLSGASSSFPRNTVIRVKNPQNDKTVELTIVKRAPRPGVFLVLSDEAGKALDIPEGQVVSVQVQVVPSEEVSDYDEFSSIDPDINPSVTVPVVTEPSLVDVPVLADDDVADAEEVLADGGALGTPDLFGDEPVPVPVPVETIGSEKEEEEPEEIPTEVHEAVDLVTLEIPEEPAAEITTELDKEESVEDLLPKGDNVIYFLTPSDFRPPTGPVTVKGEEEEIVPVLVDRSALKDYIVNQLNNGSSYIQLGAYGSTESVYDEIIGIEARYPMVVWTEHREDQTLYKLLIGPLTKDETGVLTYRFKDSGYADLFLYKP